MPSNTPNTHNEFGDRRIVAAQLHEGAALPATIGTLGPTLPTPGKTFKRFDMYETDRGVRIFINSIEVLLPWASVKIVQYAQASTQS